MTRLNVARKPDQCRLSSWAHTAHLPTLLRAAVDRKKSSCVKTHRALLHEAQASLQAASALPRDWENPSSRVATQLSTTRPEAGSGPVDDLI